MNKCKWCGDSTTTDQAEECNDCWEMRSKIQRSPEVARKIIAAVTVEENENIISTFKDL